MGMLPLFILLPFTQLFSQSFSNTQTTNIPDKGSVNIPIVVSGLQSEVNKNDFGLQSVKINVTHNMVKQLGVELQSPDGSKILLARDISGVNLTNTVFNGESNIYIDFGRAPYNNAEGYRSINDLGILNNGQDPNGTWNLIITDSTAGTTGNVSGVTLSFGSNPAKPILTSSNLPIVIINTHGVEIPDEPKIIADMVIIYNEGGGRNYADQTNYHYEGKIGIEIRGHSSQQFPKKQFGFETWNETGDDDVKVSLLGMPKESDWILSANYTDKTMMRNVLSYQLSRDMGNYASRGKYCEVIINNEYKGVFVLQEKIKRDKDRVNVEKLKPEDITEPNITGGYIFAVDKLDGGEITWRSNIERGTIFQFVYPKKRKDLTTEQQSYLQNYVNAFEAALNGPNFRDPVDGYRKYADELTFMDFFISNELAKNIDGFRLSSYFYKKRGGKIMAGPIWDFDIAWGNANYYAGSNPNGFQYLNNLGNDPNKVPFWWAKLMSDPVWKGGLISRYGHLRNEILSQNRINFIIDSLANQVQEGQQRNFTRWNIIGKYVWPNPTYPNSYAEEVTNLKNWITKRLQFLDSELDYSGGPLPVTIVNFYGNLKESGVDLIWATAQEENVRAYEIERSTGDHNFESIGSITSKGNSVGGNHYSFRDQTPANGVNLYRLKLVGMDGRVTYSNVISVNVTGGGWSISPNLVQNQLRILSPLAGNEKLQLKILNSQGQQLRSEPITNRSVITYDVSNLSSGYYILSIQDTKGNNTSLRFIKR